MHDVQIHLLYTWYLSENARRRIAILGQVPPIPALTFVLQSREKAKGGPRFLSENLLQPKLGEDK
jgi:hypothetical protein